MDRAFKSGASATPPTAPAAPSIGYPSPGDAGAGVPPTKPGAWWYHMVTEELCAVVTAAGLTPAQGNVSQVLTALQAMFSAKGAGISAWVTFNGFTGVMWASRNVASITKIDVGTYEINFTTPMSSALYGFAGSCGELDGTSSSASNPGGNNIVGGTGPVGSLAVRTAAKVRVYCWEAGTAQRLEDSQLISVAVFGG